MILSDVATGEPIRTSTIDSGFKAAFSADLRLMATQNAALGTVKLEDARTGKVLRQSSENIYGAMAFSPDGRVFAASKRGGYSVVLRDLETSELKEFTVQSANHTVQAIVFSPDGRTLVTASHRTVKLWDPVTGSPLRTLKEHAAQVGSIAFSPDGRLLASAAGGLEFIDTRSVKNGDGIRLSDPDSGHVLAEIHAFPEKEWAFITAEGYVASPGADRYLRVTREGSESPVDEAFKKRWLKESLRSLTAAAAK